MVLHCTTSVLPAELRMKLEQAFPKRSIEQQQCNPTKTWMDKKLDCKHDGPNWIQ